MNTMTKVSKIKAFVQAVTKIPAKGFNPIIPSKSVNIEVENDNWQIAFLLEQHAKVKVKLIYAWIPPAYKCDRIGFSDGIMTLGITRR
jgi:hypothetical protein